jgi:phospholipase/carboxylesterase
MSGRTPREVEPRLAPPEALAGLPVLVVHGAEDPVLPIEHGRASREFLSRLPVDLTYREYPMGHHVTADSTQDVADWLTAQLDRRQTGGS